MNTLSYWLAVVMLIGFGWFFWQVHLWAERGFAVFGQVAGL